MNIQAVLAASYLLYKGLPPLNEALNLIPHPKP